jgi:hypothetical protein
LGTGRDVKNWSLREPTPAEKKMNPVERMRTYPDSRKARRILQNFGNGMPVRRCPRTIPNRPVEIRKAVTHFP